MKDELNERFPGYVPLYYRMYAKLRKIYRQAVLRMSERKARKTGPSGIVPDGEGFWSDRTGNPAGEINKSARWIDEDLNDPEVKRLTEDIEKLKNVLRSNGLAFTNTAGTFLSRMFYPRSEKTKMWENVWVIKHSDIAPGMKVLDIGGASTAFSFYLASLGCSVRVVDNDWGNCGTLYNTDYVGKKMGWDIKSHDHDVSTPLPFADDHFDRIFSICTVEHLPSKVRRIMMKEIGRVLKPGGIAAVTMCYDNNALPLLVDKGLRFGYPDKLRQDIIKPSGLDVLGNKDMVDFREDKDFLGALFLVKPLDPSAII